VGIGAVVAIISMSLGAQRQLESRLGGLGADVLTVSPGAQRAEGFGFARGGGGGGGGDNGLTTSKSKNLTSRDVIALRSIPNVKYVMGQISGRASVSFSSKTAQNVNINGVDITLWKEMTSETLSSGRFLTGGDVYSVVIGDNIANNMFGKEIPLNTKITIAGKSFNVVGILSNSRAIYMPLDITRTVLDNTQGDYFSSISVKIANVALSNDTVTAITNKLMLSRGILQTNRADFSVSNPAAIQATVTATLGTLTLFLGAIAAISLIVGGIGIANTMFTSVLEKTKEIGIMKAIGTKNSDIMTIFLLNSGLIGLVGGIGGVIIGIAASTLVNSLAGISATPVGRGGVGGPLGFLSSSTVVSPQLIIGALLFAVLIGMVAGAIPAYRASRLKPVDALRYE